MQVLELHAARSARARIGLALAGAVLIGVASAGPASAKSVQCDLQVEGFRSYRGPCGFQLRNGGSFTLTKPMAIMLHPNPGTLYVEEDGALVKLITPNVALLFGIGGAHQSGTYLATLYRQGACWVSRPPKDEINGNARVCAR